MCGLVEVSDRLTFDYLLIELQANIISSLLWD